MAKKSRIEMDMVKTNTIKSYVTDILEYKISDTATDDFRIRFNDLIKQSLQEAKKFSREERLETIMPRHLVPAMEKIVGKKNMDAETIGREIRNLSAIDLADLVKLIEKHIQEEKAKGDTE